MALRYLRSFNTGSIADGSFAEVTWTPDEAVKIHRVYIHERGGANLNNATVYISTPTRIITRDFAPARLFQPDIPTPPVGDFEVAAGEKIYVKITNNTGAAINVDVVFEISE